MDTIAPAILALPADLRHRRIRLELGQDAAPYACGHVRSAIAAWSVPVNPAVAILLTSDLVINAVVNGAAGTATLSIRWAAGRFRVEVHDVPRPETTESSDTGGADTGGADAGRGLALAAALAAESGRIRTPAGRAVYYVLVPEPGTKATREAVVPGAPGEGPRIAPAGSHARER